MHPEVTSQDLQWGFQPQSWKLEKGKGLASLPFVAQVFLALFKREEGAYLNLYPPSKELRVWCNPDPVHKVWRKKANIPNVWPVSNFWGTFMAIPLEDHSLRIHLSEYVGICKAQDVLQSEDYHNKMAGLYRAIFPDHDYNTWLNCILPTALHL